MYPYLKEIDLGQAQSLQNRIELGEMPDISARYRVDNRDIEIDSLIDEGKLDAYTGGSYFITPLDYATHILKQAAPPEGYGYAAYELGSGRYEGLHYRSQPSGTSVFRFENQDNTDKWWYYQFRLTDLARVEGTDTDKTEINAAQGNWIFENQPNNPAVNKHWCDGKEYLSLTLIDYQGGFKGKYEIPTSTYNSLPQEFKDLAISKIETSEPPIPPSGIRPPVNDWEAKYKELERATTSTLNTSHGQRSFGDYVNGYCKQLDLADRVADLEAKNKELANAGLSLGNDLASQYETNEKNLLDRIAELEDRLQDAQNCIAVQEEKYNEVVKAAKNAIDAQEYQINRLQHYSDQREKAVLSITSFYHLINN